MLRFGHSALFFDGSLAVAALISSPECYPVTVRVMFAVASGIADKKLKISQRPVYPATRRVELGHLLPHSPASPPITALSVRFNAARFRVAGPLL